MMMLRFLALALFFFQTTLLAQLYEATLWLSQNDSYLNVDLRIQALESPADTLGDATFAIQYNPSALKYLGKDADQDGIWDDDTGSGYRDLMTGHAPPRASLDVTKDTGNGLEVPFDITRIGRIVFEILDSHADFEIHWDTDFSAVKDFAAGDITHRIEFIDPQRLGDVNDDGLANSTDALIILSCEVGNDAAAYCPMECADTNGDGVINSTDALIVLSYDAGLDVPYLVSQGGCPTNVSPCRGCSP